MPTELQVRVPAFEAVPRPRNVVASNRGLPTPDGYHVLEAGRMYDVYRELVEREALAHQGAADSKELAWIRRLSPFGADVVRGGGYVKLDVPEGMVFAPFCFAEAPANRLTNPQLDPFGNGQFDEDIVEYLAGADESGRNGAVKRFREGDFDIVSAGT